MKILLAGQFKNWAIENHYDRYLCEHADVSIYPAEEVFDEYYWSSAWNKIKYRLGLSGIYRVIATEILNRVREEKPDVVWIFKGMRILPEVIAEIKMQGARVVNYNPDHPFLFSSKGSGNRNVTNAVKLFDLHFCYSRNVMDRIEREFSIPTAFLPFGYELPESMYEKVSAFEEIPKACFIGNPDKIRTRCILEMAGAGIPVDVYGNGWTRYVENVKNVRIQDTVLGETFWKTMRAYRLQVNIFRPHNEGSHNMRSFEVPAVGGIMLAPDSPEHREFFESGHEIFLYRNIEEMIVRAREILAMDKEEADAIRQKARKRSVDSGYSYADRAREAFQALEKIVSEKKSVSV